MSEKKNIYFDEDGNIDVIKENIIGVIGYGNQGRSQALNMRDSGLNVIIGNRGDKYREKAKKDGFEAYDIPEAVKKSDILFILTPDETMVELFNDIIKPNLKENALVNFASGYNIGFDLIIPPKNIDVTMIAPRMIGVGVRERYLTGQGYFSYINVHQDATGKAKEKLLALAKAVGTLKMGCIETTMKQEAILDLYNEQAFGPAFGQVLMTSIKVLLEKGLPPEAVLIEMYMSEEMAYTYKKMASIGLVKQTNFHSYTSQYGAMSRGARYLGISRQLKEKFQKTYDEIETGKFAKEWQKKLSKLKFKVIKFFATRQWINKVENQVRENLNMKNYDVFTAPEDIEKILERPDIKNELDELKAGFEFEFTE